MNKLTNFSLGLGAIFFSSLLFATEKVNKLKDIPSEVIKYCLDSSGRIADVGKAWEISDSIDNNYLPRSILISSCKKDDKNWIILCRKGGYASAYHLVKVAKSKSGWKKTSDDSTPNEPKNYCK